MKEALGKQAIKDSTKNEAKSRKGMKTNERFNLIGLDNTRKIYRLVMIFLYLTIFHHGHIDLYGESDNNRFNLKLVISAPSDWLAVDVVKK